MAADNKNSMQNEKNDFRSKRYTSACIYPESGNGSGSNDIWPRTDKIQVK